MLCSRGKINAAKSTSPYYLRCNIVDPMRAPYFSFAFYHSKFWQRENLASLVGTTSRQTIPIDCNKPATDYEGYSMVLNSKVPRDANLHGFSNRDFVQIHAIHQMEDRLAFSQPVEHRNAASHNFVTTLGKASQMRKTFTSLISISCILDIAGNGAVESFCLCSSLRFRRREALCCRYSFSLYSKV